MIKHRFHGLITVTLLSLLVATFAPAPLAAASRSLGNNIEQDMNQGDDGQDDQDNNAQSQNQQGQSQNQQEQNQPDTTQTSCVAGTDQGSANFPTGCWTSLRAGGRHWYQFRYQGLSANRDDDDDDNSSSSANSQPATVDVRLKMETPGCISFWVMTPERLQNPDPDGDGIEEPVGAGTPAFAIDKSNDDKSNDDNSNDDSDDNDSDDSSRQNNPDDDSNNNRDQSVLNWQGAANANITFYVIVRNNRDLNCSYSLSIQGAGVPVAGQNAQPSQGQQNQDQPGQPGTQGNNNGSANNGSDDNSNDNSNDDTTDNNGNNNDDDGNDAQG